MVIPVGGQRRVQRLMLVTKTDGKIETTDMGGCAFVDLVGKQGW